MATAKDLKIAPISAQTAKGGGLALALFRKGCK